MTPAMNDAVKYLIRRIFIKNLPFAK